MPRWILILSIALMMSCSPLYAAALTKHDVRVLMNALDYVRGLPDKDATINMAILYEPSKQASEKEAKHLLSLIEELSQHHTSRIRLELRPIGRLTKGNATELLYVTHGLHTYFHRISDYSREHHILTLSNDVACAKGHACALSVRHNNAVEIFMNEGLMTEQGYDVDAAFKFMVKRI